MTTLEFVSNSAFDNEVLPESIKEGDAIRFRQLDGADVVETPLFIRQHLVEKSRMLDDFQKHDRLLKLYISGPPGCGKTSFLALWARMFAQTGKRVLLVNFRLTEECAILKLEGSSVLEITPRPIYYELRDKVTALLNEESNVFDLCVFDGVRDDKQVCNELLALLNSRTGHSPRKIRKVIYVTSLSFRLRGGDVNLGIDSRISRESFDSWVLDDHVRSFKCFAQNNLLHPNLVGDVKARAAVAAESKEEEEDDDDDTRSAMDTEPSDTDLEEYATYKYFYAGGSARFMFRHTIDSLKKELDIELIPTVKTDDWKMFTSSDVPDKATSAVNTLMQRFSTQQGKRHCVAVSKYILIHAYEKCESALISAVESIAEATGNPALKGWAFELKQLEVIKGVLKSSMEQHVKNEQGLVLIPSSETNYDGMLNDTGPLTSGTLIWCLKWNQGCFDLAFYWNEILVTLQFTISAEHSLKLEHVKHLRDALLASGNLVDSVIHIGIVPDGQDPLKFKTPTGTGSNNCETEFAVRVCVGSALKVEDGRANIQFPPGGNVIAIHKRKELLQYQVCQ